MFDSSRLAPPEIAAVSLGYMRLTDAAPLILAKEAGLFTRYGLDVTLCREVSWANLRDKLVVGLLDAAQLLAPLPMTTALGAGGMRGQLITGLALGLNGNAITLSNRLVHALDQSHDVVSYTPLQRAQQLKVQLKQSGERLTLATVHAFSMHTFLLRMWLKSGGIDIDKDIHLLVLPPEQMCDSLARGVIDGFCVGEPWSTVAIEQGIGSVVASGYDIWNNAPEKVLGVTQQWHDSHPATHLRLRLAIMEACQLLDDPKEREGIAALMSQTQYLNLPERLILPSLTGDYRFSKAGPTVVQPDFHVFWKYQAGFPWRSQALWILKQSSQLLGKEISDEQAHALIQQCWRPDLYREAARLLGHPSPSQDNKDEDVHENEWVMETGIELGPDKRINAL
ncbi:MAG: CmpA/NrtA family ABC transporter substrate-binding protein [Gammaproteobacteria bacterium]